MNKEFDGRYSVMFRDKERDIISADCDGVEIKDGTIHLYFTGEEPHTYAVDEIDRVFLSMHINESSSKCQGDGPPWRT